MPARSTAVLYQESAPGVQLNFFQNPALDAYLQLAVNDRDGARPVTVTINDADVPDDEPAQGTWFGRYEMTESGLEMRDRAGDVACDRQLAGRRRPAEGTW